MALFVAAKSEVGAVYATVTADPARTAEAKVRTTVDPETVRPVTARVTPPTVTAKALVGAVVEFNASLYVSVKLVPAASTAADTKVGATASVFEAFVISLSEIVAASLYEASSIMFVSSLPVGSVYDIRTTVPGAMRSTILSSTVSPSTVTDETVLVTPPTFTTNCPVGIVPDVERGSL